MVRKNPKKILYQKYNIFTDAYDFISFSFISFFSLLSHGFSLGRLLTATPPAVPDDAVGSFELDFDTGAGAGADVDDGTGTAPVSFSTSLNGTSFAFPSLFISIFPTHNGSPPTSCDTT
jgi:hypothetical protein